MKRSMLYDFRRLRLVKFALSPVLLAACMVVAQSAEARKSRAETPEAAEFRAANDKMMTDMMMRPSGNADADFVAMMIPHHQGAVDMARIELKYGKDPMLRKMAEDIIESQEKELGEMKSWKKSYGK